MEPTKEEDSFQQYRKYLQDSLGLTGIPTPPRPMTPFQRFYFERKCEEKSKSNANLLHLSRSIAEQWKNLDEKKRQFYQKIYEVRARQRDDLQQQFEILTKKRKIVNGYTLFCKRKYQQITNSNPKLSPNQVNKLVTIQWKNLNNSERQKFNKQSSTQNARLQLTSTQRQQRIEIYNENIKKFVAELQQEKQKILKKYGLTNKRQQKKLQRERKKQQEKQEKLRRKNEEKQRKQKQKQKQKNNPKTNNRRLIKKERTSRQQKAIIKRQLTALRKQSSLKDKIKIQVKVEVKEQPNIGRQTRSRQNLKL